MLQAAQDAFRSVVVVTADTEVTTEENAVIMNELKQRSKSDYNYTYQNDETVRSRLSQKSSTLCENHGTFSQIRLCKRCISALLHLVS